MPELTITDSQPLPEALNPRMGSDIPGLVDNAADRYGVPRQWAHAVAQMESGYNPEAQSGAGAMGVMQLMPATARSLGVRDPWDPVENVDGGVRYLAQLRQHYGDDPRLVLAAYNAGPGAVDKYNGVPPYRETQKYVATGLRKIGSDSVGTASRVAPEPAAGADAPTGDDIMSRLMRGEQVEVTPQDILQVAFGPTGVKNPEATPALTVTKTEPLAITKSEPLPPPAPPPQPPGWQHALDVFTHSSGLKLLEGLSSGPAAAVGRILGSPDYASEQSFKNAMGGLYGGIVGEPKRIYDELQKSGEALAKVGQGDIGALNDAADHLWFTIPFLGAAGAQMKEYLDRGDYWGALGSGLGVLGAAVAGSPESRAAVGEAAAAAPGTVTEAAQTGVTFARGALPAAAKTAAKRPPYGAALVGGMLGGPKGAAIAAAIAKAPGVIRAGMAGGRAAVEAAETAAGEAAPAAATAAEAAAPTPGQAYAASQGVDWSTLRPSDQQMMEDIARARANVANQPAPPPTAPAPAPAPPVMNQAQRRATVMPPETGVPEAVERAQLEREAIIGKPRGQWTNSEVIAADELRREGYTGAQPPAPTVPAAQPAPTPAAGGLTIDDYAASISKSPSKLTDADRARFQSIRNMATPAPAAPSARVMTSAEAAQTFPDVYGQPAPTMPAAAPQVPQVAPEAPAAAPAAVAPESPLAGKPQAAEIARQLENEMRVGLLTDYLKANRVPKAMVDQFGEKQWDMVARGARTEPPTPEQATQISKNIADYEQAANLPPAAARMAPAEAEAAVRPALKPGQTAAEALAEAMPEFAKAPETPAPAAPGASQLRIEKLAQHFAKDTDLSPEAVASIADNPQAGLFLEKLSASLGIKGRPARGEIAKVADRVRELRAQRQ